MRIIEKKLGCVLLESTIIFDCRGWFQIPFSQESIISLGLKFDAVFQLNHSKTESKGIIRGLNYQAKPFNQTKIVRVVRGAVYSVGVDINPESTTYGMAAGFLLSEKNKHLMYIPNTYAHGFSVLDDDTEIEYLTDNKYSVENAKSIWFADKQIKDIDSGKAIDWSYNGTVVISQIMSRKNANAPLLRDSRF